MNDKTRANQIDAAVGANVRRIRGLLGISQEYVAAQLGVTFQQVQKYEKGTNRISASKLVMIAETLDCDLTALFEGVATEHNNASVRPFSMRAIRLATFYDQLPNDTVREALFKLARVMARDSEVANRD